jgi:UPF0716 protein FxsA
MPFLLFVIYPLSEIAAFILVGEAIGVLPTLTLIVISSALGLVMLRDAGLMTIMALRRNAANPAVILAEGGSRMLAGLLLLIPGFLSDLAALAILLPPVRRLLFQGAVGRAVGQTRQNAAEVTPEVIDGDFRRIDR